MATFTDIAEKVTRDDLLSKFRECMHELDLDAVIIQSGDAHGSEIPSLRDERRAFISGFRGSSGNALVSKSEALLWTDGRYYLQAKKQLYPGWRLVKQETEKSIPEYLASKKDVFNVGIDPYTTSISELNRFSQAGFELPDADIASEKCTKSDVKESESKKKLIFMKTNIVDILWGDRRPQYSDHPIEIYSFVFSGEETPSKLKKVVKMMEEQNTSGLLLSNLDEIAWLLNLRGHDIPGAPLFLSYCFITHIKWKDEREVDNSRTSKSENEESSYNTQIFLYTDKKRISEDVRNYLQKNDITLRDYDDVTNDVSVFSLQSNSKMFQRNDKTVYNAVAELIQDTGCKSSSQRIWLSPSANAAIQRSIKKDASYVKITPVNRLKAVKNDIELKCMKEAHIKDGVAMCNFLAWIDAKGFSGLHNESELTLMDKIDNLRSQQDNFRYPSFPTISAFGSNAAIIHYRPEKESARLIRPHEFKSETRSHIIAKDNGEPVIEDGSSVYLFDSGGQYLEGTTDVTRTVFLSPPSKFEIDAYTLVLKGFIRLHLAVFPIRTRGPQLDVLARMDLWNAGLDYQHGTGHGVGSFLNVHEDPIGISPRLQGISAENDLQRGNVLSIEPGYYDSEKGFGIRIENLVYVENADTPHRFNQQQFLKFDPLTLIPIQIKFCNFDLLTKQEAEWINSYHQNIWDILSPRLKESQAKYQEQRIESLIEPDRVLLWLEKAVKPISISG